MSNSKRHKEKQKKRAKSPNKSGLMNKNFTSKFRQSREKKEPSLEEIAKRQGLK